MHDLQGVRFLKPSALWKQQPLFRATVSQFSILSPPPPTAKQTQAARHESEVAELRARLAELEQQQLKAPAGVPRRVRKSLRSVGFCRVWGCIPPSLGEADAQHYSFLSFFAPGVFSTGWEASPLGDSNSKDRLRHLRFWRHLMLLPVSCPWSKPAANSKR